jgi:type II secretory pathway pseudopilin PulG
MAPAAPATASVTDRGASVVELLVVLVLTAVLGTLVAATFVRGLDTTRNATARNIDAARAKVALEEMSKQLRTAVDPDGPDGTLHAIETGTATDVTFYSAVGTLSETPTADSLPRKVRYWVDTNTAQLREEVVDGVRVGAAPSWPGPARVRTLARDLVLPQPRAVFSYFGEDRNAVPDREGSRKALIAVGVTGLTETARKATDTVEMSLAVRSSPVKRARPTSVISRVTLMNHDSSR